ncbi:MAG TPA: endonuclease/exonuclease/phosphatase family protein [Bacteroidales bacterium]|nr:endonuclease/exonuclease/phosphatase family protein [Bacteroidales bacterium]
MIKNIFRFGILFFSCVVIYGLLGTSCKPLATQYEEDEIIDAEYYEAASITPAPQPDSAIRAMTWNIRFGIGRSEWFGDACGNITVYSQEDVLPHLDAVIAKINEIKPDILLLQEVDMNSKRTSYLNELQYILDHTYFNYAAYVPEWRSQYIPSDGLGRMDMGLAILSPWPVNNAQRVQLALRGDQSSIEVYFYLRSCMITATVQIPGFKELSVVNIHASAFATDDTKHKHYQEFKAKLDEINSAGGCFLAGGDLNTIPPGSAKTDYCFEDMCPGETFHQEGTEPYHKDGSSYTDEQDWLWPIYGTYQCALPLSVYLANQPAYFTHTTRPTETFDRTLDYLFTNSHWVPGSVVTHQDAFYESDHCPVSSLLVLPK